MHSWPIMVESMSATNSRLRRCAVGCTTISTGGVAQCFAQRTGELGRVPCGTCRKRNIDGDAGVEPSGAPAAGTARAPARRPHRRARASQDCRSTWRHESSGDRWAGKMAGGAYRRADRERQVGTRAALAERIGGVIVNADSMQVYRDLHVITARPTPAEAARVRTGSTATSTQRRTIRPAAGLRMRAPPSTPCGGRRLPILVGGTGLYFKLLTGLCGCAADPGRHAGCDPRPHRPRRAHRPCMPNCSGATRRPRGVSIPAIAAASCARWRCSKPPAVRSPIGSRTICRRCSILRRRESVHRGRPRPLRARIDAPLRRDARAGALDEVRALAARGLDPSLPAMKAHGVPWLIRHLGGEITLEEAAHGGQGRYPPLRQAAVHLVPQPARRTGPGRRRVCARRSCAPFRPEAAATKGTTRA